jgi:hypothetical protein
VAFPTSHSHIQSNRFHPDWWNLRVVDQNLNRQGSEPDGD